MENRHSLEKSGCADFFGLSQRMAEAEAEYNAAIAQAEYTGEYQLAVALYEEKLRVQEALIDAEIRQQQYALEQYQLKYQAQRDTVADQQYDREQTLKEKDQADGLELAWAAQILKEKDQANSSALAWAEQNLAQKKHSDSQSTQSKEQLAEYGELYLKAGIMPSAEMRKAMGITAADAHKYILAQKTSGK